MLFKKTIALLLCVLALTTQVNAQDMLVDTTITDLNYDVYGADNKYDVGNMKVVWNPNGTINVEVLTTFGDINKDNSYGGNDRKILFGDLLIGTAGIDGTYDYAFKLTEMRGLRYRDTSGWQNFGPYQGDLYAISGTRTNAEYHDLNTGSGSTYNNGQVLGKKTGPSLNEGSWKTTDLTNGWERLTFTFDVSGLDDFKTNTSLALSWAMTCANDVTHNVVQVARAAAQVPEPATMLMLLLGLSFIIMRRKKSTQNKSFFSA